MRTKVIIVLVIFLIWGLGSTYWYVCKIRGLCFETEKVLNVEPEKPGNLVFRIGNSTPEINSYTPSSLDSIRDLKFDTLLITGYYYKGESETIGLARAKALKDLIAPNNGKRPISITAKNKGETSSVKVKAFELSTVTIPLESEVENSDFSIEKTKDKMIIYFPSASADPHANEELMNDLRSFSKSVITSGSNINITGHTDNSGTHDVNVKYGQLRADAVAQLLVEFGVDTKLIKAESKGENEPIASNETEEGKRKNRRVEIQILDN